MKTYKINDKEYELVENYKNGFEIEAVTEKMTDYFDSFDYVVGDWSYGKLRLKGFLDENNKNVKELNNYKFLKKYIKEDCAYDARWFSIKKL